MIGTLIFLSFTGIAIADNAVSGHMKKTVLKGATLKISCNATGQYFSYVNRWWWGVQDALKDTKTGNIRGSVWRNVHAFRNLLKKRRKERAALLQFFRRRQGSKHLLTVTDERQAKNFKTLLRITDVDSSDSGKYICLPIVAFSAWQRMRTRIFSTFEIEIKPIPIRFPWQLQKGNGMPKDIASLSAGQFLLWATTEDQQTYISFDGRFWTKIKGQMMKISANSAGVWGVNINGAIFYRDGWQYAQPTGESWGSTSGVAFPWKDVCAGPPGVVLALDVENNLYCRSNTSSNNTGGTDWIKIKTNEKFDQVSCNSHGCWGLNEGDHSIYYSPIPKVTEVCTSNSFRNWTFVTSGNFKTLSPGIGPTIMAVNDSGSLLERHTVSLVDVFHDGLPWKDMQLVDVAVATSNYRRTYAITTAGDLYSSLAANCGGTLITPEGKFPLPESENTLEDWNREITCLWTVSVPSARKMEFTFKDLNKVGKCNICISVVRGQGHYGDDKVFKECIEGSTFEYVGYGPDFFIEAILPGHCLRGLQGDYTTQR